MWRFSVSILLSDSSFFACTVCKCTYCVYIIFGKSSTQRPQKSYPMAMTLCLSLSISFSLSVCVCVCVCGRWMVEHKAHIRHKHRSNKSTRASGRRKEMFFLKRVWWRCDIVRVEERESGGCFAPQFDCMYNFLVWHVDGTREWTGADGSGGKVDKTCRCSVGASFIVGSVVVVAQTSPATINQPHTILSMCIKS